MDFTSENMEIIDAMERMFADLQAIMLKIKELALLVKAYTSIETKDIEDQIAEVMDTMKYNLVEEADMTKYDISMLV